MGVRIQLRRDTAANWASANPILRSGEPGWDSTNLRLAIGDGSTHWNSFTDDDFIYLTNPDAGAWGSIIGDITDQTDLQAALAAVNQTVNNVTLTGGNMVALS